MANAHTAGLYSKDLWVPPGIDGVSPLTVRSRHGPTANTHTAGLKSSGLWVPPGIDGLSPLTDMGGYPKKPPSETEVLHRKSPENRILQKELGNPLGSQAAALCNMLFL